jgi:hypothetical protein
MAMLMAILGTLVCIFAVGVAWAAAQPDFDVISYVHNGDALEGYRAIPQSTAATGSAVPAVVILPYVYPTDALPIFSTSIGFYFLSLPLTFTIIIIVCYHFVENNKTGTPTESMSTSKCAQS